MEERMGWGEAFGAAWNNFTGVSGEGSSSMMIRALFFVLFAAGAALAVFYYIGSEDLLTPPYINTPAPPSGEADKQRLDAMLGEIKTTSDIRDNSSVMARSMAALSNYPFADPLARDDRRIEDELPSVVTIVPEVIIDYPPEGITLRAIMIMGKEQIAVMDIPGAGNGLLVKVGDTFMQRKGRIVRIAPDKVVVRWGGKNWDIAPSF
jgi:hypothetical protein